MYACNDYYTQTYHLLMIAYTRNNPVHFRSEHTHRIGRHPLEAPICLRHPSCNPTSHLRDNNNADNQTRIDSNMY